MILRILLHVSALSLFLLLTPVSVTSQDINSLKAGVVRIRNTKTDEVGTGFIVKIDDSLVYIVTSSHVVWGNQNPEVFLFNRQQQEPLSAKLVNREDESQKGLALLTLKSTDAKNISGLKAINFGDSSQFNDGDPVKIIGFPDGTSFWTVNSGTVSRVEGNYLILSGPIRGGYSGGPVISSDGHVIGMVTDVIESQDVRYAAKADIIVSYVNGLVKNQTGISKSIDNRSGDRSSRSEFCQALDKLFDASETDFYSVVGTARGKENRFQPKIMLPGTIDGYVIPGQQVHYKLMGDGDKGKVEAQFYDYVTKIRNCSKWQQKEEEVYVWRSHSFRKTEGGTIMSLTYNKNSENKYHILIIEIVIPARAGRRW